MKLKLTALCIGLLLVLMSCGVQGPPPGYYDEVAKCITASGAKMYGAFWCPKCEKQKKLFGDSVQFLPYVECDPRGDNSQTDLCLEKKIEKYPDWEWADGSREVGVFSIEQLGAKTGCEVPPTP